MKRMIIVDAYNTIHQIPALRRRLQQSLEGARETLIRLCAAWLSGRRDVAGFRLVFDGDSSVVHPDVHMKHGIQSIYTRSGETADERIVEMVAGAVAPSRCLVVTADREVSSRVQAQGAVVIPPLLFFEKSAAGAGGSGDGAAPTDKPELTAAETKSINEQLMREWGLEK
jgi:predicted RNA-binding protein with PIN domain